MPLIPAFVRQKCDSFITPRSGAAWLMGLSAGRFPAHGKRSLDPRAKRPIFPVTHNSPTFSRGAIGFDVGSEGQSACKRLPSRFIKRAV